MDKLGKDPMGSGALRRGLAILNILRSAGSDGLGVADIAKLARLPRPTVYRLIDVLTEECYVGRVPGAKRFIPMLPQQGERDAWHSYTEQLGPVVVKVAEETGSSVFLVWRDDEEALCLQREIGHYPIQIVSHKVGERLPLGVGAAGTAILAALPDKELASVMEKNAATYANYGALNKRTVRVLVDSTRARGYSVVGSYALKGVLGVGVAIYDGRRKPVGAIGVTAITNRMTAPAQRKIADLIQRELHELSDYSCRL